MLHKSAGAMPCNPCISCNHFLELKNYVLVLFGSVFFLVGRKVIWNLSSNSGNKHIISPFTIKQVMRIKKMIKDITMYVSMVEQILPTGTIRNIDEGEKK